MSAKKRKDSSPTTHGSESAESTNAELIAQKMPREKNPAAVALGKLGASKGGKARAQ